MNYLKVFTFFLGVVIVLAFSAWITPLLYPFLHFPFDRVLNRFVLVLLAVWLFFFLWRQGGFELKKYGLFWAENSGRRFAIAFLLGFLTLLVISLIEIGAGVRSWQFTFHTVNWPLKVLKYIASALLVGVFEEFIFRGFLFKTLRPLQLVPALILTNLIYSLCHFIRYSKEVTATHPDFFTALQVYGASFSPFLKPELVWPGAIGLFLFGMVLSYAYLRTGNLIFSIGIHAGAVFFLKMDRWFIRVDSETHKIWFGGTDFHASVLGWIFLVLMGCAIYVLTRKDTRSSS